MMHMTEFVNYDVVDDLRRGHHALPVEAKCPLVAACSPSESHVLHVDTLYLNTNLWGIIFYPVGNSLMALVGVKQLEC